jgi:NitT/TauT family transport system permease protein
MKKDRRAWLYTMIAILAGLAFLILIWWLVSYILIQNGNRAVPYPSDVFGRLGSFLFDLQEAPKTWTAIGWTFARLLIGFSISFVTAGILGTIGGIFPIFDKFMRPFVVICRTVPTVAIVIILSVLFIGNGSWPSYIPCFLVFLVAFPLVYQAFHDGIEAEPADELDALSLDGGSRSLPAVVFVYWPDSVNYILLAVAQSLGLTMKVSVMAEVVANVNGTSGIGMLIQEAHLYMSMTDLLAYSLLAILLVMVLDIPLSVVKHEIKKSIG